MVNDWSFVIVVLLFVMYICYKASCTKITLVPGLLSKDAIHTITLTATKKPRQTMANTRTSEKVLKPLTLAEMRTEIRCMYPHYTKQSHVYY